MSWTATRSNGIFGKSGTGKTFLTRMVLCGLVQKKAAVNLVFDMHSEYGWKGTDASRDGGVTKGLRQLYPGRVQVFTLDPRPSIHYDREIRIPYGFLEPEDVLRMLDERAAEPGEGVRVLQRPPHAEPEAGEDGEGIRLRPPQQRQQKTFLLSAFRLRRM